ncbi:hypothetical protein QCA50_014783 [Cerrena zonata]|uniref:Uncharacterized protein n=1 Tax=Cerrena zonata TaxID=2478898 RepID=A0AAW0FMU9_9APHY
MVADGNFKQDHLAMKYDNDDVSLSDGLGYMVSRKEFSRYIDSAPSQTNQSTTSTCHEHRAVLQQNRAQGHLDVTGIGAVACGRHGCFYPNSVVNFRKGEGQRYINYAFVNAINHIPRSLDVLILYDVMCQYWLNFMSRLTDVTEFLSLPDGMNIKTGIGLFHVHGHRKECFARYAPTFIVGAGMIDGEILETLWNPLNHIAPSARAMVWYHRQEYIDKHMGDSNWLKCIGIVQALYKKWKGAVEQVSIAEADFKALCESVGEASTSEWTTLEKELQSQRASDVTVMDKFDIVDRDAPGQADMTNLWIRKEHEGSAGSPTGSAAWIARGLSISERQFLLAKDVRKAGHNAAVDVQNAIYDRRTKLQQEIDDFYRDSTVYLPPFDDDALLRPELVDGWENIATPLEARRASSMDSGAEEDFDEEEDEGDDEGNEQHATRAPEHLDFDDMITIDNALPAEKQKLPLPSSHGATKCAGRLQHIAAVELSLRKGQANDALHSLRLAIGQKSFTYHKRIRKATTNSSLNYSKRLRSHKDAQMLQLSIDQFAKIYMHARKAMVVLGASEANLSTFQILKKEHLGVSTAVIDPNARGQRNEALPWIWQVHHASSDDPTWLRELYRVNWLRAKSRRDRWVEEVELLSSELGWTKNYYHYQAEMWRVRAHNAAATTPNLAFYARKQMVTWSILESRADAAVSLVARHVAIVSLQH